MDVAFNINENVRVKLTDAGRLICRKRHDELRREYPMLPRYSPRKTDVDGYTTWQLWELMQVFGPAISLACDPPFHMEIRLNVRVEPALP